MFLIQSLGGRRGAGGLLSAYMSVSPEMVAHSSARVGSGKTLALGSISVLLAVPRELICIIL